MARQSKIAALYTACEMAWQKVDKLSRDIDKYQDNLNEYTRLMQKAVGVFYDLVSMYYQSGGKRDVLKLMH